MERLVQIHNLFKSGRNLSCAELEAEFERSTATIKRDIEKLRDRFGARIVYDRESRTYYLPAEDGNLGRIEIPGLWLQPTEAYGLLTLYNAMVALDPGVLREYIEPLRGILWRQIGARVKMRGFDKKISIELPMPRHRRARQFAVISRSLLDGEVVEICYRLGRVGALIRAKCKVTRILLTNVGWVVEIKPIVARRRVRVPLEFVFSAATSPNPELDRKRKLQSRGIRRRSPA